VCPPAHQFVRRSRQYLETMQGFAPRGCRKAVQKRANQVAIENGFLVAEACARSREPQCDAPSVAWIRRAFHVAAAHQPIDRDAHRRRGYARVPRQIVQTSGLDFVEMIENAGLMALSTRPDLESRTWRVWQAKKIRG
jgi:hypothetical protein